MSVDLERTEPRFGTLLESLAQGVIFQTPDGRITFANRAAERILGLSRDELLGRTSMDWGLRSVRENGTDLPVDEHPSMVALTEGMPVSDVTMGVCNPKEAAVRWILVSAIPLFKQGETTPYEICVTFTDITKARQAQDALRESEARYRHLFEGLDDVILVIKNETIVDCNRQTQALLLCRRDEILGRTLHELAPATQPDGTESRAKLVEKINAALKGSVQFFEWTCLKCDGSSFDAKVTLTAVPLAGRVQLQVVIRDITNLKRAEIEKEELGTRLVQAQKMETVGRLAGAIAHDFNNLLAPIMAYSEMLLLGLGPDDPRYPQIRTTYEAAQRAKDLVRQLLGYGGKQIAEMHLLDLNEVVSQLTKILRRTIREEIQIEIFLAPAPANMKGDRAQIEQVVMNLAINAQDAMPHPGVLTIETANVIIDASYPSSHLDLKPGPYVMLSVSDTGQGMEKETLQHIFEPFSTTKDLGRGTGLGLATVNGIVKQHKGNIFVESEIGEGTTFKIYFPLVHVGPDAVHLPEAGAEAGSTSETIIVVEDNDMVREMVVAILKEAGYGVIAAQGPDACLSAVEQHQGPVHLLLTDVVLAERSGPDLFNELTVRYPQLRVLYMSGHSDEVIAQSGLLEKETHFIEKPFSIQALKNKIRQAMER